MSYPHEAGCTVSGTTQCDAVNCKGLDRIKFNAMACTILNGTGGIGEFDALWRCLVLA